MNEWGANQPPHHSMVIMPTAHLSKIPTFMGEKVGAFYYHKYERMEPQLPAHILDAKYQKAPRKTYGKIHPKSSWILEATGPTEWTEWTERIKLIDCIIGNIQLIKDLHLLILVQLNSSSARRVHRRCNASRSWESLKPIGHVEHRTQKWQNLIESSQETTWCILDHEGVCSHASRISTSSGPNPSSALPGPENPKRYQN